jgi:hypothetical protein
VSVPLGVVRPLIMRFTKVKYGTLNIDQIFWQPGHPGLSPKMHGVSNNKVRQCWMSESFV